jgi:hypothetical protein
MGNWLTDQREPELRAVTSHSQQTIRFLEIDF